LRNALLDKVENSVQYGEGCEIKGETYLPFVCEQASEVLGGYPDVILMENWKNMKKFHGGSDVECLKAFMVCDYFPDSRGNIAEYNAILNHNQVELAICPTPDVVRHVNYQKEKGRIGPIEAVWVPHGVDTDIFKPRPEIDKEYDAMAVFGLVSYVYPLRPQVQSLLKEMKDINSLVGDWSSGIRHTEYAKAINKSKIFICSNGVNNQVLMKYYEAMASGTFLLTNLPRHCKDFGFTPGKHFSVWNDISDLKQKIYYFLENEEKREEIAAEGAQYVREKFSTTVIADQVLEHIEARLPEEVNNRHGEIDEKDRVEEENGFFGG
jgi:glycosyltransferase involved in cell wall biosynthesis